MSRKLATIEFEDSATGDGKIHLLDNLIEDDEWLSWEKKNTADSNAVYEIYTEFQT